MNPSIPEIRAAILDILSTRGGQALGSQIGFKLRQIFPNLEIKERFGGLNNLIAQCTPEEVFCIGKSGLDNCYSTSDDGYLNEKTVKQITPWSIFHNPLLPGEVGVRHDTGKLVFLSEDIDARVSKIARVTHAEQKNLIKDFVNTKVPPQEHHLFDSVQHAEDSEYWSVFKKILTSLKLVSQWIEYRNLHLHRILVEKMSDIGISPSAMTDQSQHSFQHKDISPISKRVERIGTLKDLAIKVISQMDETQLEKVWLPLGEIWAALNIHQKKNHD